MNNIIMDNSINWQNLFVGVVAPLVTAYLTKKDTPSNVQALICFGIAVAFAMLENLASFKAEDFAGSLATIVTTGYALYGAVYKPVGLTGFLQQIGPIKNATESPINKEGTN